MRSSPLAITYSRTTSGVACTQCLWAAHTVERRQACNTIIAFGIADKVRRRRAWHAINALGRETRSNEVGRGMQSSPLDSADGLPSSGVACHHSPWTAHTVGRRRALHAIIALGPAQMVGHRRAWHASKSLGQHKRSAVVGRACTQRSAVHK